MVILQANKQTMIKNILFDMGGVIFDQDTDKAFRRFAAAGIDTDRYLGKFGQQGFFLDLELGKIDEAEFCRRMAEATGRPEISHDEAAACWQGFYSSTPLYKLHALDELRKKYHLGLLSNTNPFMMELTDSPRFSPERRPISSYFDSMFLSCEMKLYKPDRAIYEEALRRDGMKAEETLFIDDSLKNVEGARLAGLHGLHVPTNADWRPLLNKYLETE